MNSLKREINWSSLTRMGMHLLIADLNWKQMVYGIELGLAPVWYEISAAWNHWSSLIRMDMEFIDYLFDFKANGFRNCSRASSYLIWIYWSTRVTGVIFFTSRIWGELGLEWVIKWDFSINCERDNRCPLQGPAPRSSLGGECLYYGLDPFKIYIIHQVCTGASVRRRCPFPRRPIWRRCSCTTMWWTRPMSAIKSVRWNIKHTG